MTTEKLTKHERIQKVFVEHLGVDSERVTPDATFEDLGADSLDRLELIMNVEQEFDIDIPEAVAQDWTTVGDVNAYIAKNVSVH